jgi:hypothetical protein
MTVKLTMPRLRIVLADETELEVQPILFDSIAWDETRNTRKWPNAQQAPQLWAAFLGWHTAKRQELITLSWEEFRKTALETNVVDEAEEVDPTPPAPIPSSSSD